MKHAKPKLTIVNRSEWSTAAITVLSKWIVKRAGINWNYTITVRGCKSQRWGGRGWRSGQRVWIDRNYRRVAGGRTLPTLEELQAERKALRMRLAKLLRNRRNDCSECGDWDREDKFRTGIETREYAIRTGDYAKSGKPVRVGGRPLWPITDKDHRFKWSSVHTYRTRFEALVMLLAHEAYHATGGHPDKFKEPTGRGNDDFMEFRCNEFAMKTIEAMREQWATLRPAIVAAMRKEHERARKEQKSKRDPGAKLHALVVRREAWESKLKRAERAIAKIKQRERYYIGKIAAKGGKR